MKSPSSFQILLLLLALCCLVADYGISGFVVPPLSSPTERILWSPREDYASEENETRQLIRRLSPFPSIRLSFAKNNGDGERSPTFSPNSIPQLIGTMLIAVLAAGSAGNLFLSELPMVFSGDPNADYFGAVFDTLFLGWAGQTLLLQTGALADSPDNVESIDLDGLQCRINVDVGREGNTWMPKDWAASGGRLVLPVNIEFTDEQVDLGIPGEEGLGGRYCRRVKVLDDKVSFVGPQGQMDVLVADGGWATLPILNQKLDSGERKLRFFLEFPDGAARNDVTIPSGRVYFSSACLPPPPVTTAADESISNLFSLINAPSGAGIFKEGGVTIKSNGGILNLWGAAGDINLILGKYSVTEIRPM